MKILSAFLLVIFFNTQNVTSYPVFEVVAEKLKEFATSFMTFLRTIRTKVNDFIDYHFKRPKGLPPTTTTTEHDSESGDEGTRKGYISVIEESAPDSETEHPEMISLRCEPTALMTTPQLAKHHGKKIESHVVITGDGYLLTLHRLMKTLDPPSSKLLNSTVLLHHGLLGSSADWLLLGPEKSLPYILSNLGYDVWMTNARGNDYSRGHVSKNVNSLEYWKFSWQEMGQYDLPAVVDYIRRLKKTNETMDFIGHSMGATAFLVLLSTTPKYNKYFRIGILLAPLAYMSHIESPLRIFTPMALNIPGYSLKLLGEGEFFSTRKIPSWIGKKYCSSAVTYCSNPLLFLSGNFPATDKWSSTLVANILYHVPAGGSTNTILHYAYLIGTGKFQKYKEKSEFPLRKVKVPISLFSSGDDWLSTIPDVLKLYLSILNPIDHYIIRGKNFTHTDFVFGPEANHLVFDKVVEFLQQDLFNNSAKRNEV